MATVTQQDIDQLKEDFKKATKNEAEEKPVDFAAFLYLTQIRKMAQLIANYEINPVRHQLSWAEVKNFLDDAKDNDG